MDDFEEYRFCGHVEPARSGIGKWQKRHLFYAIRARLGNISDADLQAAYDLAIGYWQEVCGLTFERARDPGQADIYAGSGTIDGPGGVLAWSELPDGSDRPLQQKYDTSERYVIAEVPGQGQIDLVAVMSHELGHAVGLDHAPDGSPDLMAPVYQPGRRRPQAGDIRRIQALYGPPVPRPSPDPKPPAPGEPIVIKIYNADRIEIPGYTVTRMT